MNIISDLCKAKPALLLDGATGTNLFALGLPSGTAPELWNIDQPDTIVGLHRRFVEAGSDLLLTNSFGANTRRLMLHGADGRVEELNAAAARLARAASTTGSSNDAPREYPVAVLGSIGPTGDLLFPLGEIDADQAEQCFYTQACGLLEGGVDGFWIETLSAIDEARAAICGVRRATTDAPIFLSMSFDTAGKTMMGVAPENLKDALQDEADHLLGLGANCGVGPAELLESVMQMRASALTQSLHLVAKSNYGVPQFRNGALHYHGSAPMMADYARFSVALGVKVIGGCCGTTPEIIRAMRQAINDAQSTLEQSEINAFIAENRATPNGQTSPEPHHESTAPSDRLATDTPSAAPTRSRRRRRPKR